MTSFSSTLSVVTPFVTYVRRHCRSQPHFVTTTVVVTTVVVTKEVATDGVDENEVKKGATTDIVHEHEVTKGVTKGKSPQSSRGKMLHARQAGYDGV